MSLKKLMAKTKEVEVELNGEKVKFEIIKPNQFVWEKIRKLSELESAKLKMSSNFRERIKTEVMSMSDEEVIDNLASLKSTADFFKAGIRIQEERYPETEKMRAILEDESSTPEQKSKAQKYLEKYQREVSKEIERIMANTKVALRQRKIEDLRKELIEEKVKVEAEAEAYLKTRIYQIGELCLYNGKKLSSYNEFEEFIEKAPDEVLNRLFIAIDEFILGGLDIKKLQSLMSS